MEPALLKNSYQEKGFVVLSGIFAPHEISGLKKEIIAICQGQRGTFKGLDAPPPPPWSQEELQQNLLCIHFPHKVSQVFLDFMKHPELGSILSTLIGPNVKSMQSMLFIKSAGKPGQAWHQDEFYIPTRDRSLLGAWIPLDQATVENGCLWVLPGSHQAGIIWPTRDHADSRFDASKEAYGFPWTEDDAVAVEVEPGDVVLFHGHLLHRSLNNRSRQGFRRALVYHYMSAESMLPWPHSNDFLDGNQHVEDHRDIVLVRGTDPYAFKGTRDIVRPFLRHADRPHEVR